MGRQIKAITGFEPKEEGAKRAFLSASPSELFMITGFNTLTASVYTCAGDACDACDAGGN